MTSPDLYIVGDRLAHEMRAAQKQIVSCGAHIPLPEVETGDAWT